MTVQGCLSRSGNSIPVVEYFSDYTLHTLNKDQENSDRTFICEKMSFFSKCQEVFEGK